MNERRCETRIEQCHMTGQIGAISSVKDIPPDCLIEICYIDKKGHDPSRWDSFVLWTRKLAQDKPVGVIVVEDFMAKVGTDPKHASFLAMYNDWWNNVEPARTDFRTEHVEGGLEWIKCHRTGCRGTVTHGEYVCSTCGCLTLYADRAGVPYCPAYPSLKGELTGLTSNYTEVKKEAAAEAEKAIASSKAIVATLANLHCQGCKTRSHRLSPICV